MTGQALAALIEELEAAYDVCTAGRRGLAMSPECVVAKARVDSAKVAVADKVALVLRAATPSRARLGLWIGVLWRMSPTYPDMTVDKVHHMPCYVPAPA